MTERVTILAPGRRESSRGLRRTSAFGLPPELLERARYRMGRLALLMAVVFLGVMAVPPIFGTREDFSFQSMVVIEGLYVTCLALAMALFWVARSSRFSHDFALNSGLVFEVILCFLVSLVVQWRITVDTGTLPHITWASPTIILYPLVVPTPPRKTLLTALLAAATGPFSVWLLDLAGAISVYPVDYVGSAISPAVSVVFAVFGASVIYGMGREVAKARELGSYQLEECLGSGGMGEVWRARHRLLARPAAIKMIQPEALAGTRGEAPEILVKRFEREARATASMCSEHTIDIYDFGVAEDGMLYYVMELLHGFDMDHLVKEYGPVESGRCIWFLRQICHSLGEAHDSGLIHRDVKPANLYVCRYGRDIDFVKVLDFGLVKTTPEWTEDDLQLTAAHSAGGTPAFMSPEQVIGDGVVDGRTDIYALGCVGYWLLTGQMVFEGRTPMEVIIHHTRTEPVPPSRRTEVEVPAQLDAIILGCLAKDPAARPQSVDDLDSMLRDCPLERPWTGDRAREWWQIHQPLS